jgi:hypothetical protein
MVSSLATASCHVESKEGSVSKIQANSLEFSNSPYSFKHKKLKLENVTDFVRFANYKTLPVPNIQCGDVIGKAFIFFDKKHIASLGKEFIDNILLCLGEVINVKKWIESQKENRDVYTAEATARLFEDGDYYRFLNFVENKDTEEIKKILEEGKYSKFLKVFSGQKAEFNGFEHILLIKQDGKSYHIMPAKYDAAFANFEQMGLIKYAIYQSVQDPEILHWLTGRKEIDQKYTNMIAEWASQDEKSNATIFRKGVLKESRVYKFNGWSREYSKCIIFQDVIEGAKKAEIYKCKQKEAMKQEEQRQEIPAQELVLAATP